MLSRANVYQLGTLGPGAADSWDTGRLPDTESVAKIKSNLLVGQRPGDVLIDKRFIRDDKSRLPYPMIML